MSDLDSRAAIDALLLAFYDRALDDEVLGPVFRAAGMDLATHLPRIAAFWERTLLGTGRYDGRPMPVHRRLEQTAGLGPQHYVRWLALWHQALDSRYDGPLATRAGEVAERMATALQRDVRDPRELPLLA
ncbi:MAG: group III truncated hemoglobin [Mycobacteriales bacterium]